MNRHTQTSFMKEGWKRIACYNCNWHIAESYLGEKKVRIIPCPKCKTINQFCPPKPGIFEGKVGMFFGPDNCIFSVAQEDIDFNKLCEPEKINN